jgi:hypothetical protein
MKRSALYLSGMFLCLMWFGACAGDDALTGADDQEAIQGAPVENAGTSCGPNVCGAGTYCCNPTCGVCLPLGHKCLDVPCGLTVPPPQGDD